MAERTLTGAKERPYKTFGNFNRRLRSARTKGGRASISVRLVEMSEGDHRELEKELAYASG